MCSYHYHAYWKKSLFNSVTSEQLAIQPFLNTQLIQIATLHVDAATVANYMHSYRKLVALQSLLVLLVIWKEYKSIVKTEAHWGK